MSKEKNNRPANMTAEDQAALDAAGKAWNDANAAGDQAAKDKAHADAEAIRAKYNYSGGADGGSYIPAPTQNTAQPITQSKPQTQAPVTSQPTVPQYTAEIPDFTGLLDKWLEQAQSQQQTAIDYATEKGVADLERAEADAQEQFQTQQDQVSRDEAKALDNQALYSEARGDKGGIGQAQYGQIQATAMQNRRAINSARTKLATDTARAIADLRAQGEFEKADALLQLGQTYLAQLVEMQQWGAEYAMNVAQFNAQLQQWQAEYNMQAQQYADSVKQWQMEWDYSVSQNEREWLAQSGIAALSVGMRPSAAQQAAMGYTDAQIDAAIAEYQLAKAAGVKPGSGSGSGSDTTAEKSAPNLATNPYDYLYYYGVQDATTAAGMLQKQFGDYALDMAMQYMDMLESGAFEQPVTKDERSLIETAAQSLGLGPISYAQVESLVESGKVDVEVNSKGGYTVKWADGYSASNYNKKQTTASGKLGAGIVFNDPLGLFR